MFNTKLADLSLKNSLPADRADLSSPASLN